MSKRKAAHDMRKKISYRLYVIIRFFVKLFYPKIEVVGTENLPDEPCVVVGNHTQMNGPIACELYFPGNSLIWCAGQMMHLKEVPDYAFSDFWSQKPKAVRWLFRIASYAIAPISVLVFNNAGTIAVYHDTRIISTFRRTVAKLQDGASIIIFPEHDKPYNHILCDFQDKFIDIAKMYYRKTGRSLSFVPMYIAPRLKKMILGTPIRFRTDVPIADERKRICEYLMTEITDIACALPEHIVIPYRNIPKKFYPSNVPEEASHEETRR